MNKPNNSVAGAALAIGVKPQVLQDALYLLRAGEPISTLVWDNSKLLAENAKLKAENKRLRSASFVTAVPSEEYEKLKAENERLRKAGDEIVFNAKLSAYISPRLRQEWEAAKEGGDR